VLVQPQKGVSTSGYAAGKMRLKLVKSGWRGQQILLVAALKPACFDLNLKEIYTLLKRKNGEISLDFVALWGLKATLIKTALYFGCLLTYQCDVISTSASNWLNRTDPGKIQTKQQQHPGTGGCGKKSPELLALDHVYD
jgi:hypothetical protein